MIAQIEGILAEKNSDSVIVSAGGVGFELSVSANTLTACPAAGQKVKLYAHLSVREDAMEMFGFLTKEEKRMFLRLISVTGIGPRTALGILSALSVHELSVALVTGDAKSLAAAPGIGKKTAQRLILELKDKVEDAELTGELPQAHIPAARSAEADAIEALMALGYPSADAARAVSAVSGQADKTNDIIFLALRHLGGGN